MYVQSQKMTTFYSATNAIFGIFVISILTNYFAIVEYKTVITYFISIIFHINMIKITLNNMCVQIVLEGNSCINTRNRTIKFMIQMYMEEYNSKITYC